MPGFGFLHKGSSEVTNKLMGDVVDAMKKETGLYEFFDGLGRQERVMFTPGGLLMLVIPTIEAAQLQDLRDKTSLVQGQPERPSFSTVTGSVERIARRMRDTPATADVGLATPDLPLRSSLSVLRAAHEEWCKIPPFC